ncbi:MAG: hypothetical protein V1875_03490 [Candidatus Altiarchaeota archaeon]
MESDSRIDFIVALVGVLFVGGILYETLSSPIDVPSGYLAAYGVTSCCTDCSCDIQEICSGCPGCVYTSGCLAPTLSLTPGGLEILHAGRVSDNSSFILNAVLYPKSDGQMLVEVVLPRGFTADRNSVVVDMYAGERMIVPFRVFVKENVAEMDHRLTMNLVTPELDVVCSAEGTVSVYWEH